MDDKVIVGEKTRKDIVSQFQKEKLAAMKSRQVRVTYWSQNDQLYSGQPNINLLTRANLHVPKVFEGVQTMSSRIGGRPDVEFDTAPEGDENAPEIMESLFEEDMDACDADGTAETSQIEAGLYGRAIYKVVPRDDGASVELIDTLAFLINPTAKSTSDGSMIYGGQQFIFKTIDQIEKDAEAFKYDKDVIEDLKVKKEASETPTANSMEKSLRELRAAYLGYANVGQTGADMVELTEWYTVIEKEEYVLTVANDTHLLRCIKIEEAGLPRKPYISWATFPRGVAFWTPSIADVLRDPNLAMDVTLNQMIDNNTYRNFGMVFVESSSGVKQGSIVPRPLGVIPVTVGGTKTIKDSVMHWTPPEIGDAQQTLMTLNSLAESAVGLAGGVTGHKGKQSVTQQAAAMALIEGKTNKMRRNFIKAWKEVADLYAEVVQTNMSKPRRVKVYGKNPTTLDSVTKENFKDVHFIAKATASELSQENKAIRQKAAVELFELFKDDPMIPGQKKLRERVAKEFDMSPQDMGDLFTATPDDEKYMQMVAQQKAAEQGGGGDGIPANPENPQLSANGQATASHVPQAIR